MVFRRKIRRARRSGGFFRKVRRSSSSGGAVNPIQIDAMAYGAARKYAADLMTPISNMLPFGQIADELAMGTLNYFVAKNTSGLIKNVAMKGLVVENARLGEAIVSGGLSMGNTTQNNAFYMG